MKNTPQHFLSTVMGGLLFLVPIGITALIFFEIYDLLLAIVEPIAELLPVQKLAGVDITYLVTAVLILLACYAVGRLVRTRFGGRVNQWLEGVLLSRLPGYSLAKSLTRGVAGRYSDAPFPVALARIHGGEAGVLGLVMERHLDGRLTIFVPQAPTPTLGTIYVVPPDRVEMLETSASAVLNSTMQWGIGTEELLTAPLAG